ncbi:MAG: hypothetical protein RIR70_1639 [Pseudomonadota bacterium]|jgi:threonine/homoserine/homoserine lactone efflux protein
MQFETWLIFLLASIGLSLSPGPNGLLALTHGALYGHRKALFTIAGGVLGFVAIIGLCMFGISALIKASVLWLSVLKWLGGAYLIWLGIAVWRSPPIVADVDSPGEQAHAGSLFRQGLFSAVTNPKALLFFSAFLPQFIDPQRSAPGQFAVVAATFAVTEFFTEYALALTAHRIRPWLSRVGRQFNRVCGAIFIAIGTGLPLRA